MTDRARARMVRKLRARGIADERVLAAMAAVPRERFLPVGLGGRAYESRPQPIAEGQTMSEPWIVAAMTAALGLTGTERVLEIGAGSGYAAAVLAQCAGQVVTVEHHAELARSAATALAALGYHNVEVRHGDGSAGAPDRAPFDAISVTAMAQNRVPPALLRQLADHGVLVAPVGHDRHGDLQRHHRGQVESLAPVGFVPLVER